MKQGACNNQRGENQITKSVPIVHSIIGEHHCGDEAVWEHENLLPTAGESNFIYAKPLCLSYKINMKQGASNRNHK